MLRAKAGKTAGVGFVGWMSLALLVPLGDSFADAPPAAVAPMPSLDGAGYFWRRGRQVWPTPSVLATLNQNLFLKLPKGTSSSSLDGLLERHHLRFLRRLLVDGWIYVQSTDSPVAVARALVERGEVLDAEPSSFVQPELHGLTPSIPSDPYFDEQWPLAKVVTSRTLQGKGSLRGTDHAHVAEAWALLQSLHGAPPVASLGNQVRLAIIDDGFDLQHEDLKDKFVASANFGSPLPPGTLFRGESPRDFHGTLVTGIAAASTDNGKGMAGACPGCRLVAARMASHPEDGLREDQYYDQIFAWVMAQNPDVINCSWGPGASVASSYFEDLVDQITTQGRQGKGTILVVASGNAGASMDTNPLASHPRSITVGASDSLGARHGFSNFGLGLDLLAPTSGGIKNSGVSTTYVDPIWSTDNYVQPACLASGRSPSSGCSDTAGWSPTSPMAGGDGWDGKYSFRFSHTSAAAPLVAGIVGLMLDANPQLSASDVQTILQETADPVRPNDAFYDGKGFSQTYGYGRINALRAVARAYEFQGLSLPTALADAVEQASPCLRASCANPRAFGASSPSGTSPGQNGASLPPTPTSPSAGEATANAPAKSSEAAPSSANANSDANSEANSRRNESLSDDGQTSSVGAVACSTGGRPAPQSLRGFQPYFFLALAWATFRWRRKDRPTNTHMQPTPRANYKLQ